MHTDLARGALKFHIHQVWIKMNTAMHGDAVLLLD